jgi:hypothetical protein
MPVVIAEDKASDPQLLSCLRGQQQSRDWSQLLLEVV